jgi:predicted small metal-binding protein
LAHFDFRAFFAERLKHRPSYYLLKDFEEDVTGIQDQAENIRYRPWLVGYRVLTCLRGGKKFVILCQCSHPRRTAIAIASAEEELLKKVVEHAAHQHGVTEVAPELAAKVKAAIKSEAAAK